MAKVQTKTTSTHTGQGLRPKVQKRGGRPPKYPAVAPGQKKQDITKRGK